MFARLGIRLVASLAGIAVGILLADVLLTGFSASVGAIIETTIVFWVVNLGVSFLALKVLVRNPSVPMAGLLALASTILSLIIVNVLVSGLSLSGTTTYVFATLIIWITSAISVMVGGQKAREQRR
jgi:peptidoglycan/LPS O-acetylase OafA/YrhL